MDLLGNKTLLSQVQKVMVSHLCLVDFDPFCVFVACDRMLSLTAAKNAIVKVAFEL